MLKKIPAVLLAVFMVSCVGLKSLSREETITLMDGYFDKINQNNFELLAPYYSELFYEETPREEWEEIYNSAHAALGPFISSELVSWTEDSVVNTSGSGKYFTFVYKTKYENGDAEETFVIVAPKSANTIRINSHLYDLD
ncbi:MAG: hypothetical protein LBT39_04420 [Treponema sp.]|nr:hypothetical protein [Treponema sp.]